MLESLCSCQWKKSIMNVIRMCLCCLVRCCLIAGSCPACQHPGSGENQRRSAWLWDLWCFPCQKSDRCKQLLYDSTLFSLMHQIKNFSDVMLLWRNSLKESRQFWKITKTVFDPKSVLCRTSPQMTDCVLKSYLDPDHLLQFHRIFLFYSLWFTLPL